MAQSMQEIHFRVAPKLSCTCCTFELAISFLGKFSLHISSKYEFYVRGERKISPLPSVSSSQHVIYILSFALEKKKEVKYAILLRLP